VLAFGDSITNGGGELQWGVALQSWALWTARGLGLAFTGYATDAATVRDVVEAQIPRHLHTTASPEAGYDVGCLYIGVNDVRSVDWDREDFEKGFREALGFLAACCERTLTLTAPLDLGRPRAGAKVKELNEVIRRAAEDQGALVLDLSNFSARNHVMADHVHPTAFGQIAIAERALAVLAADGLAIRMWPSTLISFEITRWRRLRGDLSYMYRHAKVSARSLILRTPACRASS
jgi:lysophospholipase L1-like esterase